MEEKKEDIALYHQRKRRKHKIKLATIAAIAIAIALILTAIYSCLDNEEAINYTEKSSIGYRVYLKENEFYKEDYLDEGLDIIASLIKNIDAEFKYNLNLQQETEYTYSYRIIAETKVKEKSKTNSIYEAQQELLSKPKQEIKSKNLEITEKINIDYQKYNEQINKLLDIYKLSGTTSKLKLVLYLEVNNKATGEQINQKAEAMSLEMPLTTRTTEVLINENINNNNGKLITKESQVSKFKFILAIAMFALIIGIVTLGRLIKYIFDTRSAEKMYEDELKKILFDYKSYIQKVNNQFDYQGYKLIKIDSFKELIEMREEIQSPILMYTEERKTTFMMLSGNLLFEYVLGADLIRQELIKRSKEKAQKKEIQRKNRNSKK